MTDPENPTLEDALDGLIAATNYAHAHDLPELSREAAELYQTFGATVEDWDDAGDDRDVYLVECPTEEAYLALLDAEDGYYGEVVSTLRDDALFVALEEGEVPAVETVVGKENVTLTNVGVEGGRTNSEELPDDRPNELDRIPEDEALEVLRWTTCYPQERRIILRRLHPAHDEVRVQTRIGEGWEDGKILDEICEGFDLSPGVGVR